MNGFAIVDLIRRDLSTAYRALVRTPGSTLAAILILALGIGGATATVAAFQSIVLKQLPVPDEDRLVALWPEGVGGVEISLDAATYRTFRASTRTMTDLAGFVHWGAQEAAMTFRGRPLAVREAQVTDNFFSVLGASPVLGRLFRPADQVPSSHVVVISYAAWQREFGGDPGVIGTQVDWLSAGQSYTVVGVAPPGLDYPIGAGVWIPAYPEAYVDLIGRLRPGISLAAAKAELANVLLDYRRRTGDDRLVGTFGSRLTELMYGDARPALIAMLAAAGLLLVIACTNVGNLLLLRASDRARELAIRRALGASAVGILRQLFVESSLLAGLGGGLGFVLAIALLRRFAAVAPSDLARGDLLRFAPAPLGLALTVTFAAVLLTGLAPVFAGAGPEIVAPLRLDARVGGETRRRRRIRSTLVAGQVALALIVLHGASLLTRSLVRLETVPLGYDADRLTFVQVVPPPTADTTFRSWIARVDRLLPAVRAIPGVVAVSPLVAYPFTGANTFTTVVEASGSPGATGRSTPVVSLDAVGPDFFRAIGLPLLRGTGFTERDQAETPAVAVVTETIARRLWPGQNPIGKRLRLVGGAGDHSWRRVVGLTPDVRLRELTRPTPMVFVEYHQLAFWQGTLAIRTQGAPAGSLEAIRAAITRADPDLPVWFARPMNQILSGPLARPRLDAGLLLGFSLLALVLAAVGLYAVIGWTVRQRTRELGIRIALGAGPGRVRQLVLGEALSLIGLGSAVGVIAALFSARLLRSVLFEITPDDPGALLAAAMVLAGAGLFAGYWPARRATRIDPVRALNVD